MKLRGDPLNTRYDTKKKALGVSPRVWRMVQSPLNFGVIWRF